MGEAGERDCGEGVNARGAAVMRSYLGWCPTHPTSTGSSELERELARGVYYDSGGANINDSLLLAPGRMLRSSSIRNAFLIAFHQRKKLSAPDQNSAPARASQFVQGARKPLVTQRSHFVVRSAL